MGRCLKSNYLCGISSLLAIGMLTVPSTAAAQDERSPTILEKIATGQADESQAGKIEFPKYTYLLALNDKNFPFELIRYEGEIADGVANGHGTLFLKSIGYDPSGAYISTYEGEFVDGVPAGEGTLIQTDPFGTFDKTVTGLFSDHETTMWYEGKPITSEYRLESGDMLKEVTVYQTNEPTRKFFLTVKPDGTATGGWVDIPWYFEDSRGFQHFFYRDYLEISSAQYGASCSVSNSYDDSQFQGGALAMTAFGSPKWVWIDQKPFYSVASCRGTSSDGWSYAFTIDFSKQTNYITPTECWDPSGRSAVLLADGSCEEKRRRKHDIFTNIGQEVKRFIDRRILGTINRGGEGFERGLCRATGTEPGKNCNVNASVGVSWPVGEGSAPGLPPGEQAARQDFIAAVKRGDAISHAGEDEVLANGTAVAADLNAVCVALCATDAQKAFSEALLQELEVLPNDGDLDRRTSRATGISRGTASVLSGGLRIIGAAAAAFPLYKLAKNAQMIDQTDDALRLVYNNPAPSGNSQYLRDRQAALISLHWLMASNVNSYSIAGVETMGAAITTSLKLMANLPPAKRKLYSTAIGYNRTAKQINDFLKKYKDVKTEEELNNAIIKEALAPLGIAWPPQ